MTYSATEGGPVENGAEARPRWVQPKIDTKTRRHLSTRNSARAWVHIAFRLAIQVGLIAGATLALRSEAWLAGAALTLLSGAMWGFLGWAGLSHELFHGTVFASSRQNRVLFRVFSVLSWGNYGYFEVSHWLHHKYTRFDRDPESADDDPIRLAELPWLVTLNLPAFAKRVVILARNSVGYVPPFLAESATKKEKRSVQAGARVVLLTQTILVVIFLAMGMPEFILLITLGPFICSLPVRILELVQHKGLARGVNDFRLNTRTVRLPFIFAFLYCNMNYHVEHHVLPSVPYYHLPKLQDHLVAIGFLDERKVPSARQAIRIAFER